MNNWLCQLTTRDWEIANIQMYQKPHILGSKNNWGMQSKMVFKICEGISCSSIYVKEFDVIVYKNVFFLYNVIIFLSILYSKSLANLAVEVGTRHSHQILLTTCKLANVITCHSKTLITSVIICVQVSIGVDCNMFWKRCHLTLFSSVAYANYVQDDGIGLSRYQNLTMTL